jgi:hypothetical protein
MKYCDPDDSSPDEVRANALGSAIVLRDCSLRREMSFPTRRACRTLMRAQAIKWRQLPRGGNGAHALR